MKLAWYVNRLRRMSLAEMGWRARNKVLAAAWRRRMGEAWPTPARLAGTGFAGQGFESPGFEGPGFEGAGFEGTGCERTGCERETDLPTLDHDAAAAVLTAARGVLTQPWPVFGVPRDLTGADPDWHRDPRSGRVARADRYCFDVRYRDDAQVPGVKHMWEVSRLHHVTLLAAAYALSGDARYARHAAAHWASWWRANPPLMGPHWVSGIEMGLRLIGMVWTRRLLDRWPGAAAAFEDNPDFRRQLHAHQTWIATFHSRHSSSNNHVIAEMAGLLAAAHAFPLFPESAGWADLAAAVLTREADLQTFPDGVNREMASEYHVFVLELLLIAGAEADHAGKPLPHAYWRVVRRMADALAGMVDARGRTGRQGDSDSGHALVLDPPGHGAEGDVLAVCAHVFGAASWWPKGMGPEQMGPKGLGPEGLGPERTSRGVGASLLSALATPRRGLSGARPVSRPDVYPDAGMTLSRTRPGEGEEIWCRLDHGPHGFLSTTAHAHADALSVEVRLGGQEILIDPGTYCYHDERVWRDHFRSTAAHNTLEIGGRDQAIQAGPFLWLSRPSSGLTSLSDDGVVREAGAWHDGYSTKAARVLHHRRAILDRGARALTILDRIEAPCAMPVRLAFHFHPDVRVTLTGDALDLSWSTPDGPRAARMRLPDSVSWRVHRGESDPPMGWYSPGFGQRQPAYSVIGSGVLAPDGILRSHILFMDARDARPGIFEDSIGAGVLA